MLKKWFFEHVANQGKGRLMVEGIHIRRAEVGDFDWVSDLMQETLEPYYGGDHHAHARRIFDAHIAGGYDRLGFFSFE